MTYDLDELANSDASDIQFKVSILLGKIKLTAKYKLDFDKFKA